LLSDEEYVGMVWPNEAVFPDFYNPDTTEWWHNQLSNMKKNLNFDGLWLDMNEIANFCDGICRNSQTPGHPV
jgi:alpha-glucosidase (family GH31 glycosyl hydrolase)